MLAGPAAAGVALALSPALAGCSDTAPKSAGAAPRTGQRASSARAGVQPDVHVAERAVAAIASTQAVLAEVRRGHPGLAGLVGRFSPLHTVHLRALRDAVPAGAAGTSAAPSGVPASGTRAGARALALSTERQLIATLTGLALRAESGDFARLLASMVAALDQRLGGLR